MSIYASAIRDNKNPKWNDNPSSLSLIVMLNGQTKCTSPEVTTVTNGIFDINFACVFHFAEGENRINIKAPNHGADADSVRATIEYDT